jgi:hypothetical protein
MQHTPVHDASRERAHQFGVWNASEVVREVGVHDVRVIVEQRLFHIDHRLLGIAPLSIGILLGWKVGFKDRVEHQHCGCHAHPIPQGRDAQRPQVAVGFRDKHSSDRIRSVLLLLERKRQFPQPPLYPIRLDIPEVLTVHTRCALVRATLSIGMRQDVFPEDLVVQGVEPIAGFCLRFRV